jgi:restriction endonuclease Mrr
MPSEASELPTLKRIRRLTRGAFVDAIAEIYRGEGYLVEQAATRIDGGYDLVLLREASVLVQCKHWLVDQVGVAPVRELARAMQKVGATGGVIFTTGAFTKAARELATSVAIELVDGKALARRFSGSQKPAARKQNAA